MKRNTKIIGIAVVAIIIGVFLIPSVQSSVQIPFTGMQQGINIGSYFDPFATVGAPAPAIACSLTNNVHLISTNNADFSLSNTSPIWSPLYYNLIIPYNGYTLDHVLVKIYLYCSPSKLTQYNYYPYLTGGSLSVSYIGRDTGGIAHHLLTVSPSISPIGSGGQSLSLPLNANGQSIEIAQVSIPASTINNGLPSSSIDYLSLQNIETTGTLNFKQNLANSITAVENLSPLYTSFSYTVHTPTPVVSCSTGRITIGSTCYPLTQSLTLPTTSFDKSKTDTIPYTVNVNGWTYTQAYPYVRVINTATNTIVANINLSRSADSYSNYDATWHGSLSIKNNLGGVAGKYEIELAPELAGTFLRATSVQDFVVFDSTVSNSSPSNPNPAITSPSTTGNVQFLYKVPYQSGFIDTGLVPQAGFSIPIHDLITDTSNGKMTGFSLQTLVNVNDPIFANMNILSSTVTHNISVTVKGYGVIQLPNSCCTSTGLNTRQSSGQAAVFSLDLLSLDVNSINQRISQAVPAQLLSNIPVVIEVDTTATFTLQDSTGHQYKGTITGAAFTYGTTYGISVSPLSTANTAQNVCTATQIAAGFTSVNGVCTAPSTNTPNTCHDSAGNTIACTPVTQQTPFCQQNPNDPSCNTSGQPPNSGITSNSSNNQQTTPSFCQQFPNDPSCVASGGLGSNSNGTSSGGTFNVCPTGSTISDCVQSGINNLSNGANNLLNGGGSGNGSSGTTIFGFDPVVLGVVVGILSLIVGIAVALRNR